MADQGEKYEITSEGYLTINNVQMSDSGIYRVDIRNEWGDAQHSILLTATPTGKLIIQTLYS